MLSQMGITLFEVTLLYPDWIFYYKFYYVIYYVFILLHMRNDWLPHVIERAEKLDANAITIVVAGVSSLHADSNSKAWSLIY